MMVKHRIKHEMVNSMTAEEILRAVNYMKNNLINNKRGVPYISKNPRGWICNLKATKKKNGEYKYPQFDCNRIRKGLGKILVHAIWYHRYKHR
jgi:hypothetical protein